MTAGRGPPPPPLYFGIWALLIAAQLSQLFSMYVVNMFRVTGGEERGLLGREREGRAVFIGCDCLYVTCLMFKYT